MQPPITVEETHEAQYGRGWVKMQGLWHRLRRTETATIWARVTECDLSLAAVEAFHLHLPPPPGAKLCQTCMVQVAVEKLTGKRRKVRGKAE